MRERASSSETSTNLLQPQWTLLTTDEKAGYDRWAVSSISGQRRAAAGLACANQRAPLGLQ